MRQLVGTTSYLKDVFTYEWFNDVEQVVGGWDVTTSLGSPVPTPFVAYSTDVTFRYHPNVLAMLDDAFVALNARTAKKQRIRSKLHSLNRNHVAFISTTFEMLIVAKFAEQGCLVEYEPVIGSGVPEARIVLGGMSVLLEARARIVRQLRGGGFFDPGRDARAHRARLREKCVGQLSGANEPVVLCYDPDVGAWQLERDQMCLAIERDPQMRGISAVVFSDTYRARQLQVWRHPDPHRPLTPQAMSELRRVLAAEDFVPSGVPLGSL